MNLKKLPFPLVLFFFYFFFANAQEIPLFLEGSWKVQDKEQYEVWTKNGEEGLLGKSFEISSGQKKVFEKMAISKKGKKVVLSAMVSAQNEGRTIDFVMYKKGRNIFSFENPEHDFPQKITYKKIGTDTLFIKIEGEADRAFSYKAFRKEAPATIPEWFIEDMKATVGIWKTSNSKYQSPNENFDAYGLEWKWSLGQTSLTGRLYGINDGKEAGDFWNFLQYWDNVRQEAVVMQYGFGGAIGIGAMKNLGGGTIELIQTFSTPSGDQSLHRHLNITVGDEINSTTFEKEEGTWKEGRNYIWHRQKMEDQAAGLGQLSLSLAVKDLEASLAFYQKLGFQALPGAPDQKWIILTDGQSQIGLIQGMFLSNALTFNPSNARAFYQKAKSAGLEITMAMGMDKDEGPCSFAITDPDGNSILIDQH